MNKRQCNDRNLLKQKNNKKCNAFRNNRGSTLVTVIICLAFISILGAMMLSVTMTNLQMKMVESRSKQNFYSSEKVLDKIRVAVQETVSDKIKLVYETEVLVNYATYLSMSEAQRNSQIQRMVALEFFREMGNITGSLSEDQIIDSTDIKMKSDYFLSHQYLDAAENSAINIPMPVVLIETDIAHTYYAIRLKDITIKFIEGEYRTAIVSDIVITLPKFSFTEGSEEAHQGMVQPYQNYVLLADDAIISDNPMGVTSIQGDVYAGVGGINISGQNSSSHKVEINRNGGTIVTRGNITVSDTADLTIGPPPISLTSKPIIWADNLVTYTSDTYPTGSTMETKLNVNGINVIHDDLTLEGRNSKVNIDGAYIGYSGTHDSKGSSIIINGYNSSLNLSDLTDLILAGRAHVSVEDTALNKEANILTGESIAFKSNQRAYLLPSKFITNVLHNPVTEDDLGMNDEDPATNEAPIIAISDLGDGLTYTDYLAPTPYKIAAKQTGLSTLRYYYLNFISGKLADKYLKDFMTNYPDVLDPMEPFLLGNVTLPDMTTASVVGNAMSYDSGSTSGVVLNEGMSARGTFHNDSELDSAIAGITLNKSVYTSSTLQNKTISQLEGMYTKITHLLTLDSTKAYQVADDTIAATIKTGGVGYLTSGTGSFTPGATFNDIKISNGDAVFNNTDAGSKSFWVINGNVTINPNTVFHGFLIATGNITIGNGALLQGIVISTGEIGSGAVTVGNSVTLQGRIITTGTIRIGHGCNLGTDAATEQFIADIFAVEGTILSNIFKNAEMTVDFVITNPASSTVDLSDMISYENWKRIE